MLQSGIRRFHIGRKPVKISTKDSGVSVDLIQSAQALRSRLSKRDVDPRNSEIGESPLEKLEALAKAITQSPKVPPSVFQLINRTLVSQPNYKGSLSAPSLQLLFRAVASHSQDFDLATKLYADIYRHSGISADDKLENGKAYYKLLRSRGFTAEADQMVSGLLKENSSALTDEFVLSLAEIATSELPETKEEATKSVAALMALIRSYDSITPSPRVLTVFIQHLVDLKSVSGIDELATYIYFTKPHFDIPGEVSVVLLDAYLQLGEVGDGSGQRLLGKYLAEVTTTTSSPPPLEVCELLLMASIHFQEPVSTGKSVKDVITSKYSPEADYSKETWDALAQWTVYSSPDPLVSLQTSIPTEIQNDYFDNVTLRAVISAASDKAQCTEQQITDLVEYFDSTLRVAPDAAAYEILIRRALKAVEIERARQYFVQSNTDWAFDHNAHSGVLSDLLVALCRTTSIPRQTVMDTYQRVRLFVPKISYDAQVALLDMFLKASTDDLTPAGLFLIDQFGEKPDLPFLKYRGIFDLFFTRILASREEGQAWDLFGMLNCTIHLPYEAYYPLQQKLCSLGRPDAAHLLFRQLRARAKKESSPPPGEEMYMMLFTEYAKWRYEEGILELESYFRVDLTQEMTTPMMNRMLGAYVALGDGHKVRNLWTEAVALPRGGVHGPNAETMLLMLHFFNTHMGMDAVEDLWTKLPSTFKIAPNQELLKQYVIANCYHGYYSRALELVRSAPERYGIDVNRDILQSLYNWTMLPARKQEVKEYAEEHHPELWSSLIAQPNALKEVLLPLENEVGETDEPSVRLAAIKKLEEEERMGLIVK